MNYLKIDALGRTRFHVRYVCSTLSSSIHIQVWTAVAVGPTGFGRASAKTQEIDASITIVTIDGNVQFENM